MDTVKTVTGKWYNITASAACSVSVVLGGQTVPLVSLSSAGFGNFCAPGDAVQVETSGVYRLFPIDAPCGAAAGGAFAASLHEALYSEELVERQTSPGTANATAQAVQLDAQQVPAGELASLALTARASGNPSTQSYLALEEQSEDGATWVYLGSSLNAPAQINSQPSVWEFPRGLQLAGRAIRLTAQRQRGADTSSPPTLGLRTSSAPDTSCVYRNGTRYAFLAEAVLSMRVDKPRYAPITHVGDPTHLQEECRVLRLKGANGNNLLVMRGNVTNVSVTSNELSFNVPKLTAMTSCPAVYSYNSASGDYDVTYAATPDDVSLAPLGLRAAGTYVGAPSRPLFLRGTTLSFNESELDMAGLAELLAKKEAILALLGGGQAQSSDTQS